MDVTDRNIEYSNSARQKSERAEHSFSEAGVSFSSQPFKLMVRLLEQCGIAAVILGEKDILVSANSLALAMQDVFLRFNRGQIWIRGSGQRAHADCSFLPFSRRFGARSSFVLQSPGNRTCVVSVRRLPELPLSSPLRLLIFREDASEPRQTRSMLVDDLGLSNAEASVAIQLHRTCDLLGTATNLGLSKETVRTQLKAVFAKLGVSKQSEVVLRVEQLRSLQF